MRLIDADALLFEMRRSGKAAYFLVLEAPTIDPESLRPQWIPVTERLPDTLVPVLIQHTYMEWAGVTIGYITNCGYWEWFGYFMGDDMLHYPMGGGTICPGSEYVTHWMPLPEPYNPYGAKMEDQK